MYRLKILILAVLTAVIILVPQTAVAQAADSAAVSLQAPVQVLTKASLIVKVNISQVNSLNAANFRITYDPALLTLDNVTDGMIGLTTLPVEGFNVVEPGLCNVINTTEGLTGLTGSGTLATITFHALSKTGKTEIQISEGVLSNTDANAIDATWTGISITVKARSSSGGGGGGGGGGAPAPTISPSPSTIATPTPTMPLTSSTPEVTASATPTAPATSATPPVTSTVPAVTETTTPPPSGTVAAIGEETRVTPSVSTPIETKESTQPANWMLIIGLIAAVLILLIIGLLVFRRRSAK